MSNEKIHRTICGKYVSLLPGDVEDPSVCDGCIFDLNESECEEASSSPHTVPHKDGGQEAYCSHYNGVWRKEEVKANRLPRRKLT